MISEGFVIIPLVTGTNFLLSFPRTYSTPLSNAGRRYASYSADYHQDPCRGRMQQKTVSWHLSFISCPLQGSIPFPQNPLCTGSRSIYKLSGSQKAWHTAPAVFVSYFKGTEPVFTSQ